MSEVTQILDAIEGGDSEATDRLLPIVYNELRDIARRQMLGERSGHSLQATALVHEAYLKLIGNEEIRWVNRAHFFGAAAESMRRILVDSARKRDRIRHGGGRKKISLEVADLSIDGHADEILALDEAITKLEEKDPRMSQIVKLRFYSGLGVEETAQALNLSPRTVKREWAMARAWLFREIQ